MRSEEISSDVVYKTWSVLGDVTNQDGKRGFLKISTSGVISGDGSRGYVEKKNESARIAKKQCLGTENLKKESFHNESMASVLPRSCSEINSLKGNLISGISKIPCQTKEPSSSDDAIHISRGSPIADSAVKVGDSKRDSCVPTIATPTSPRSKDCVDVGEEILQDKGMDSEVVQENPVHEKVDTSVCTNDGSDLGCDNLESLKSEYIECSRLPESQESISSGLERCIRLKGDRCSNSNLGIDSIKACSCSFCTKAAYILSDLHYQDIKGRIAVTKKSQKEVRILVESCRDNGIGRHGQGNSNRFLKLESDLMGQWRSLFLRMEDILVRESSQLETNLLTMQDLRDNCKSELVSINGMPPEKH